VQLHRLVLDRRQAGRLEQNGILDTDLADVVQQRANADQLHVAAGHMQMFGQQERVIADPVRMEAGIAIAEADGLGQDGNGVQDLARPSGSRLDPPHQLKPACVDKHGWPLSAGDPSPSIQTSDCRPVQGTANPSAHTMPAGHRCLPK